MPLFELLDGDESDLRETIAALSRYIERLAPEALSDHQVRDLVNSARLQRGTAFLLLKDDTAAQTDFQQVLANQSAEEMRWRAHLLLGAAYAEGGQDEQALACWTEALEAFEQSYQARRPNCAVDIAQLYLYRAMMHGRLLHYQEAMADCDRALEYAPHEAEALAVRGIARAFLGDLDLALADCTQAVEYSPQVEHLSRLGEVHLLRQEYQQAFDIFDRAAALNPENQRVALQRSQALGWLVLGRIHPASTASRTPDDKSSPIE